MRGLNSVLRMPQRIGPRVAAVADARTSISLGQLGGSGAI
jgi:hypothetical protein